MSTASLYLKKIVNALSYLAKKHPLALTLLLITLFIALANYTPNTYLTGWDTLHPEFNYRIYWARILGGVWQEHQGLGAVAAQAHVSEIPRILILMLIDLFVVTSFVRYAYAFLMLIIGPLGVYFFVSALFKNDVLGIQESNADMKPSKALQTFTPQTLAAFAAGLLYLLNLGTLQHFYVPLEMFLTHYGFLGWIFLYTHKYLKKGDKRSILIFGIFTFLTSSQAHTATLFYAFMLNYAFFLAVYSIQGFFKKDLKPLKRSFILGLMTIVLNLYWFLPNLYFALRNGAEIQKSKIHFLFSKEAFIQNSQFGNIKDTAIIKNFLFNWGEHTGNAQFGDLFNEWKIHLAQPGVLQIGYIVFALVVLGFIVALIKKNKYTLPIVAMLVTSIFFLFNINPPLGNLFIWMQDNIPLFEEAFRFPFTKFSITLMFTYSVFFGFFFGYFFSFINSIIRKLLARSIESSFKDLSTQNKNNTQGIKVATNISKLIFISLTVLITSSLVYYALPMFKGGLISPSMRVNIPNRYFEMFDYFDSQNEFGRVANLPIHSFWGWAYYNWDPSTKLGYQGAGFLWFGIKQPLLDREFDRWNLKNENYYYEMSYAVYSKDSKLLESVLEKYQVRWLILDESVIVVGGDQRQLFFDDTKELLVSSENIKLERSFGDGLSVYKYYPKKEYSRTTIIDSYYEVNDIPEKEYFDSLYFGLGNYIQEGEDAFPFVGIKNFDESLEKFAVVPTDNGVDFRSYVNIADSLELADYLPYKVSFGSSSVNGNTQVSLSSDLGVQGDTTLQDNSTFSIDLPVQISDSNLLFANKQRIYDGSTIYLPTNKEIIFGVYDVSNSESIDISSAKLEPCSQLGKSASYSIERFVDGFTLSAQGVNACVTARLSDLVKFVATEDKNKPAFDDNLQELLYISYESENFGTANELCIFDESSGLCQNDTNLLQTFAFFDSTMDTNFIRFMANGLYSNKEVSVNYKNLEAVFGAKIYEKAINFNSINSTNTIIPAEPTLSFAQNLSLGGNVTKMQNYIRFCNSNEPFVDTLDANSGDYIRYNANGNSICDSFQFNQAKYNQGYLLEVESRNIEGMPLRICMTNEYSKRCDIYVSLHEVAEFEKQYFFIPSMINGEGYTANISNLTFGDSVSINDLKSIRLIPIPYKYLKSLYGDINTNTQGEKLLVYNESFDEGWLAFCGIKPCKAEHVLVNGWANGWVFDASENVAGNTSTPDDMLKSATIVFWPQTLEVIGLVFLVVVFGWFAKSK